MTEEPYRLILAPGARRALTDLLPGAAAIAAWEFISGPLVVAPRRVGARLRAPFHGHWRARRGEYRVRYEIDEATRTVRILDTTTAGMSTGHNARHTAPGIHRE